MSHGHTRKTTLMFSWFRVLFDNRSIELKEAGMPWDSAFRIVGGVDESRG